MMLRYALLIFGQTDTTTVAVGDGPNDDDAVFDLLRPIYEAFKAGDWALLAGLVLTLIVFGARAIGITKRIPHQYDKYVSVVTAILLSVAAGLQAHRSFFDILTTGVSIGFIAIGSWEAILQPFRNKLRAARESTP